MGRSAFAALAGLALAAATCIAQQRSPAFVTVVDAEGKPLANAEVTCAFTPNLVNPWPRDIVTATTDARGRARCDLFGARLYSVWAVGAPDANGTALVTDVFPFFAASFVREIAAREPRRARRIVLGGLDAWREVGAVRVRWFPDDLDGPWRDLEWPSGSAVEIPPSPYTNGALGLVDAAGALLVAVNVPPDKDDVEAFAPPMLVVAKVIDDASEPIAGASILRQSALRRAWWSSFHSTTASLWPQLPFGTTDAEGVLRFHVPTPPTYERGGVEMRAQVIVSATAPGRTIATKAVDDAGNVQFALAAAPPIGIALTGTSDGERAARGVIAQELVKTSRSSIFVQRVLPAARETPDAWRVETGGIGFVPFVTVAGTPPTAVISDVMRTTTDTKVALAARRRIEVLLTDPKGGPVQCAVGVMPAADQMPFRWRALVPTDTAGRVVLYVPPDDLVVYATDGAQHALARLNLTTPSKLELTLEAIHTMRLRVLDAAGQPVEGARAVAHEHTASPSDGEDERAKWLNASIDLWWCYVGSARSDANGLLLVPAFVRPGLQASVLVRARARDSGAFALVPGAEDTVTIR